MFKHRDKSVLLIKKYIWIDESIYIKQARHSTLCLHIATENYVKSKYLMSNTNWCDYIYVSQIDLTSPHLIPSRYFKY